MKLQRLITIAVALTILQVSAVSADTRVKVSGRVCGTWLEFAPTGPLPPGQIRCNPDDAPSPGIKVVVRGVKSKKLLKTVTTRSDGTYQVKLSPGRYLISPKEAGYEIRVRVGKKPIKNVDFPLISF